MSDEPTSNSEHAVLSSQAQGDPSSHAQRSRLVEESVAGRETNEHSNESLSKRGGWKRIIATIQRRRAFAETVFVSFAVVGLQLLQGILLARMLGPVGRGEYATAVLYPQLLMFIGMLGGIEVIARRAAMATGDRRSLRAGAIRLGLFTGTLTTLAAIVFDLVALPADKRYLIPFCALAAVSCIGLHVHMMLTAVDRGYNQFRRYNARRLIATGAFPFLLVVMLPLLGVSLVVTCIAFVLASTVAAAICFVGEPESPKTTQPPRLKRLLKEGRPYALLMLANDLFERVDLVLILWLAPLEIQGYYAAILPTVYPLTIAPNNLGLFLFNVGANKQNQLTVGRLLQILVAAFGFQAISTVGFLFIISPAIRFLYGPEFLPAVAFAYWLAPAEAMKGISQGLDGYLKGRGRPTAALGGRLVAFCLMLTLIVLLYPKYSVMALPMGACGGQLACVSWLIFNVLSDLRRQHDRDDVQPSDPNDEER